MTEDERPTQAGMLCPACKVDLVMTERQNVEIDYCPKCRGVWLDRGELDKIIEKSASQPREQAGRQEPPAEHHSGYEQRSSHGHHGGYEQRGRGHHGGYEQRGHGDHGGSGKYGSRRKSWLGELFD